MSDILSLDTRVTAVPTAQATGTTTPHASTPANATPPAQATEKPADEKKTDQRHAAFDEQGLDKISSRLIKRDPDLSIEQDKLLGGYVYRFLDSESGQQISQFPAKTILDTLHALAQAEQRRAEPQSNTDLAV